LKYSRSTNKSPITPPIAKNNLFDSTASFRSDLENVEPINNVKGTITVPFKKSTVTSLKVKQGGFFFIALLIGRITHVIMATSIVAISIGLPSKGNNY